MFQTQVVQDKTQSKTTLSEMFSLYHTLVLYRSNVSLQRNSIYLKFSFSLFLKPVFNEIISDLKKKKHS